MADLTRFDFHALRFTKSYSIMDMSNDEVGQYVFLLCEAWLGGKDTTLPDSVEILSKLARTKKVSEKVLAMFPIVDLGFRRNGTLYGEWMATKERLAVAEESGRRGGEAKKAAYRVPTGTVEGDTRQYLPKTRPDQTDSNQTNQTSSESFGQCTFKNISVRYSSYFGVNHSKGNKHIQKYQAACSQYGEDKVLEYFEMWAEGAKKWLKERRDNNGLNFFWRPLEEIAEGDLLRVAREQDEKKKQEPEISDNEVKAAMDLSRIEQKKQIEKELEELLKAEKWAQDHRDEI